MQTFYIESDRQAKTNGKTLTLTKHKDITLNYKTQTAEKRDSLVLNRADF